MSESRQPSLHLARALEELLRGTADAVALWRERSERGVGPGAGLEPLERAARALELALAGERGGLVAELRGAVRAELARWDERASGDPAAARVRDLFAALDDVISPAREPRTVRRSAPRRRGATGPGRR